MAYSGLPDAPRGSFRGGGSSSPQKRDQTESCS